MIRGVLILLTACLATAAQAVTVFPTTFFASSGYVPPAPTGMLLLGDSRLQNSAGNTAPSTTLVGTQNIALGYSEYFSFASKNNLLLSLSSTNGAGSTSSLNADDRASMASNYAGATIGSSIVNTGTGAIIGTAFAGTGGFPGYLSPGTQAAPGTITITFGAPASVASNCTGPGTYTPFTVTASGVGVVGSSCVNNGASATVTYGGAGASHSPYGNFVLTQSASCTVGGAAPCAQSGDTVQFTTFGPQARAQTITAVSVDAEANINSSGAVSPAADPANTAFVVTSINDTAGGAAFTVPTAGTAYGQCPGPNYTQYASTSPPAGWVNGAAMSNSPPCLSMVAVAHIVDQLIAGGKTVFLEDESPGAVLTAQLEPHAVGAHTSGTGTGLIPSTQAATFYRDGNNYGTSTTGLGQAVSNVPGLIATVGTAYTVYNKVTTLSGVNGEYTVVAGNYNINNTDPLWVTGGNAYLSYSYGGTAGVTQYQFCMHSWLSSSAADFVCRGTDFHFPGAKYNRKQVITLPIWNALVDTSGTNTSDPNCVTSLCNAIPGALDTLGKHPTSYAAALVGAAFGTVWSGIPSYAALADNTQAPVWNNLRCARSSALVGPYTCTLPATMMATGHPHAVLAYNKNTTSALTLVTESGGNFTNSDISSGTINYSTGAVSITFTSTGTAPPNLSYIWIMEDMTNMMSNALFDTTGAGLAADKVAPCANTTGPAFLPAGWSCTATNAGLTIVWSTGTGSDSYPSLTATVSGVATGAGTVVLTNTSIGDTITYPMTSGNALRAGINELIAPNSGHLIGLFGASIKLSQGATGLTRAGYYQLNQPSANLSQLTPLVAYSVTAGNISTSAPQYPLSDLNINGVAGNSSGIPFNVISTPIDLTGATASTGTSFTATLTYVAGPVSAVVTFERAQYRIRTN